MRAISVCAGIRCLQQCAIKAYEQQAHEIQHMPGACLCRWLAVRCGTCVGAQTPISNLNSLNGIVLERKRCAFFTFYMCACACVCQVQYLKGLACEILQYSVVCWVNVWPLPAAASARYRYLCQHSSKSIRNEWHETLALTLNALVVYNILWEAFGGGVSCGMSNLFEHALILL